MTQLSLKVLQKVAEELNDFLDITPRISTKSNEEELSEKILEAAGLLVVDGKVNELLELSKTTQKVIHVLQTHVDTEEEEVPEEKPKAKMKVVKPTKDEDEEPPLEFEEEEQGYPIKDLPNAVKKADLTELKEIIKRSPDIFVTAAKGINLMKDVDKIREKALNDLGVRTTEKVTPKKENHAQETKQATKGATVENAPKKGTGVIATIVKCLEDSGKSGISREDVLTVLCKKFPERTAESMKKTIQVQLPGRISKERFPVVKLEGGLYAKK